MQGYPKKGGLDSDGLDKLVTAGALEQPGKVTTFDAVFPGWEQTKPRRKDGSTPSASAQAQLTQRRGTLGSVAGAPGTGSRVPGVASSPNTEGCGYNCGNGRI